MNENPYQVAVSSDKSLPHRKWNHLGTVWAVSHRSAAYASGKGSGDVIAEHPGEHGVVFEFPGSVFVKVGFGS